MSLVLLVFVVVALILAVLDLVRPEPLLNVAVILLALVLLIPALR